ncbi:MAG: hypothetical protein ACFFAU_14505 [Candidatus Hodarchaeota archaeon]
MLRKDRFKGILGLWIIEKASGIPIYALDLGKPTEVDSVLFGGALVAIRGLMTDLKIGELNSFQTNQSNLIILSSDDIFSVLALEKDINVDFWYSTLYKVQQIVEQHYQEFKEKQFILDTTVFDNINPILHQVVLEDMELFDHRQDESVIYSRSESISVRKDDDFKIGDLDFLFEYFPHDLGKVLYTLLMNEPIIIIGDIKDLVEKVIASIDLLTPLRELKKEYAIKYIDPMNKDLIICSSQVKFTKKYKDLTKVDVNKRKISADIKDISSMDDFVYGIKIMPKESQARAIREYVEKILSKITELKVLCQQAEISSEKISRFRSDLNSDELNIVISRVREESPQFSEKLFHFARSLT